MTVLSRNQYPSHIFVEVALKNCSSWSYVQYRPIKNSDLSRKPGATEAAKRSSNDPCGEGAEDGSPSLIGRQDRAMYLALWSARACARTRPDPCIPALTSSLRRNVVTDWTLGVRRLVFGWPVNIWPMDRSPARHKRLIPLPWFAAAAGVLFEESPQTIPATFAENGPISTNGMIRVTTDGNTVAADKGTRLSTLKPTVNTIAKRFRVRRRYRLLVVRVCCQRTLIADVGTCSGCLDPSMSQLSCIRFVIRIFAQRLL